MKIISREEFLKMPKYTVFSKTDGIEKALVGPICVKYDNYGSNDFYFRDINNIDPNSLSEKLSFVSAIEKMQKNPAVEYPGKLRRDLRDGLREENMKFVIYDLHEIKQIIKLLAFALRKLYGEEVVREEIGDELKAMFESTKLIK